MALHEADGDSEVNEPGLEDRALSANHSVLKEEEARTMLKGRDIIGHAGCSSPLVPRQDKEEGTNPPSVYQAGDTRESPSNPFTYFDHS